MVHEQNHTIASETAQKLLQCCASEVRWQQNNGSAEGPNLQQSK
jgi:hypothetical protein